MIMLRLLFTAFCCFITTLLSAQMPDDGFTMSKGELCLVAGYKGGKWKEYWEGTRLRENKNVGTFTTRQYMPMAGYGISNKLNVFASLPYISNSSDAGTMMPQRGWQDFSVAAKYRALHLQKKRFTYSLFATLGASVPSNKYVPDFLPYSIGIRSKTASARVIGHVAHQNHFFVTAQTGYTLRSNIKVDRATYYTDNQYYSNEMAIPNVWDGSLRAGFSNQQFRLFAMYNVMQSLSGSDIRRNDMPYPGNKMNMQTAGIHGQLWIPGIKGLAINAAAEQTIAGRNVGKAFMWMTALQYVSKPFSKKKHH